MARESESSQVLPINRHGTEGFREFATSLVIRSTTISAVVLFVNVVARSAYFATLVPGLGSEILSFRRLLFFDEYMAFYSALLCTIIIALPSRNVQRVVYIWNPSAWRHWGTVGRRLLSFGVFIVIYFWVGRWLVDRWLGVCSYLERLVQTARPAALKDFIDAASVPPSSPPAYLSLVSYVVAISLFVGLMVWLMTAYYRAKRRPLIEWRRYQTPIIYHFLHILVPSGTLLILALFLLQVPIAYGSARASYTLRTYSRKLEFQHTLILNTESTQLADASILCSSASASTPLRFCYGSVPSASRFLYVGLETDDGYYVVLADGEAVQRVTMVAKSAVVEMGLWQLVP
jgi:hypothetical protein